eukprot:gene7675-8510_t
MSHNTCEEQRGPRCVTNSTASFSVNCSTITTTNNSSNQSIAKNSSPVMKINCNLPVSNLNLFYSIFLIIVAIVALVGNVIVCVVISQSRKLRSQSINHLLLSLAVSDILVSVLSLPVKIHVGFHNQQFCMSDGVCWFFFYSDILANCSSVTHLLVISIQRFIAISMPFNSQYILSRRRIDVLIALVWLYSAMWSILCTFNWSQPSTLGVILTGSSPKPCQPNNPIYWTSVYIAVFIIPLFVMACLQLAILRSVKLHTRRMMMIERNADKAVKMRKREIRVARTVSIVYAAFTACWLPVCLLTLSSGWCPKCFERFQIWNEKVFIATFLVFVHMLPPLSSTLNPFIYVISGDEFRKAIKTVLFQRKRESIKRLDTNEFRSSWKLKDSSFTGPYDVLLTYADDNATGFFKKIGFTDDPVLACKYRKISDNWLNSTPMCFIPHFSSSFYPVFMDDKDSIDKQIEAVEQYIDKWRIQQTGAYQHQMHCILKATRQLKLLKETVEQQEKIIKRLKTENLKLRQAPDDQLDFTTTKEKNKNIIKWEFCQQLLVEDSIVDVDVIRITKASLCREYFDLKLATLSDPLMFDDLYYCGGKSKTELERILQYGFSQDDINNSDLRKGLGFTQNPRNAMEFTIPGTILLCTIGLGNTKTVVTDTHFRSFPPDGFDSILTTGKQLGHDCEHPSSHYIIFDAAQALPVCLIDYNVTWLD